MTAPVVFSLPDGSERLTCPRCKLAKPRSDFGIDRSKASGRKSVCKECDRAKAREWYERNRERKLAYMAAKRAA